MFSEYSDEIIRGLRAQWEGLCVMGEMSMSRRLEEVIGASAVAACMEAMEEVPDGPDASRRRHRRRKTLQGFDGLFERAVRRRQGMYYTPSRWADVMASALEWVPRDRASGWRVADLSAGDGALLCAAVRARPECVAIGVEKDAAAAMSAAMNLVAWRARQGEEDVGDRMIIGSGLSLEALPVSSVACVFGNPPYLGEKGNRDFFLALTRDHPHLAAKISARVDLLYLFLYRAMDVLEPGGVMVHMTSAYWLQATGAAALREELLRRTQPVLFWHRPGNRLFADAPGHHSLITVCRKLIAPEPARDEAESVSYVSTGEVHEREELPRAARQGASCVLTCERAGFRPFVSSDVMERARAYRQRCASLSDFFGDHQGFVSGADRVTGAHVKRVKGLEEGAPLFLFEEESGVPELLRPWMGDLVQPVLRGGHLVAGHVWREPHVTSAYALYIDGVLEGERLDVVEAHFGVAREILERRREVKMGRIPWYRMHWPRVRSEQQGDKLVMARRGAGWCVAADFGGHLVSSDLTYVRRLGEGADVGRVRRELLRLQVWLEQEEIWRDLVVYGKQKGELYEFYSGPLREVPVALCQDRRGEVVFDVGVLGEPRAKRLEDEMRKRLEA